MNDSLHSSARYMRKVMFILGGMLVLLGTWKLLGMGLSAGEKIIGWLVLGTVAGQCVLAGFLARLLRAKEPIVSLFTLWGALGTTVFCWVVYNLDGMVDMTLPELRLLTMMGVSFQLTCILLGLVWPKPELKIEKEDAESKVDGAVDDEDE